MKKTESCDWRKVTKEEEGTWKVIAQRWRAATGLSQSRLARELGCHLSTVTRWEQDKLVPSEMAAKAFRRLVEQVSPSYFSKEGLYEQANN